ncbi:MAG: hypothetical protein OXG95_05015 [Chloroflexi bacterium]|nr:hypothetical protein [Chloroflexota bacterium]
MSPVERPTRASFYDSALDAADRHDLHVAREVEGLDDEVALLRLQLRRALAGRDGDVDPKVLHGGVRLLMQALLAQHRLSPKQAEHLGDAVANVLEEFGEVLGAARE